MRDTNPPIVRVDPQLTPAIRLLRKLGSGGMGTVWAAHHATLGTAVAVKILSEERGARVDLLARVGREVKAASRVKSPHVVRMIDCGAATDGRPYLVMELLEGRDLGEHLESRGPLPLAEVIAIVRQITHALGRAHEQGVVHRDVKPSNVFLCEGGDPSFVKLLDFGIAKLSLGDASGTTSTGGGAGTPTAMSPEQIVGGVIDHRSDIWALGVLVYRALTGRAPYQGETLGALALAIHNHPAPSICANDRSLPAALDTWFAKACARAKEDRFTDVDEAMHALDLAAGSQRHATSTAAVTLPAAAMPATGESRRASAARPRRTVRVAVASGLMLALFAIGARAMRASQGPEAREERSVARAIAPPLVPTAVAEPQTPLLPSAPSIPSANAPPTPAVPPEPRVTARPVPRDRTRTAPPKKSTTPPEPPTEPAKDLADEFPHERH